ncbi:MAG: HD domain-containing protein [Rikenellaceae bacterium]
MENFDTFIQEQVSLLIDCVSRRLPTTEIERIKEAFEFAAYAHRNQKRKSGEPYITHPIAVARIIGEELMLDSNTIIAAFLHDVVEDTDYTIEDISIRFGDDVAFLVKVVTKQKKEHYEMSKQLDNYKQMLDSVQYDIRAILIKLSDRLHNMRTLSSMRPDKQMKIAGETDYFYAPLANRLGLYYIKTELENLSFHYRCPEEYAKLEEELAKDELENREWLNIFTSEIQQLLENNGVKARLEVDFRMPYSLWRRIKKSGSDFRHIDYRHVINIIFEDTTDKSEKEMCLSIYSILTDSFKEKPGSIRNYLNAPKENGYTSFHVKLLCKQRGWEDIHITSEKMLSDSTLGCIADHGRSNIDNWIDKFKQILQDIAYHSSEGGFMDSVKSSFYDDDILVFTPLGKAVILPKGASALDFAFEIHSNIGLHAQYAKINGKLSSIKSPLYRGDCVEIGVSDVVSPKSDWMEFANTYKSQRYLGQHLRKLKTLPFTRCDKCFPIPGDEVIGFVDGDGDTIVHKRNCDTAIKLSSQDGDSLVAVNFMEDREFHYPVMIKVKAVDRYHLLSDLINSIAENLKLSIDSLTTTTTDEIVDCSIKFYVHSIGELQKAVAFINNIEGVDEVRRV